MPITNTEAHELATKTLDRSKKLLAEVSSIQKQHADIRSQIPFTADGDALAWLHKKLGNHPRLTEEVQKFEAWKKSRPELSLDKDAQKSGRGNWQAV